MRKQMYCIYRITNKVNGKTYIGQHKYSDESNPMKGYKGSGVLLHLAYKKYGEENFETEVLYKRIRDKETVDDLEIRTISKEIKLNGKANVYNLQPGGGLGFAYINSTHRNVHKGRVMREESKLLQKETYWRNHFTFDRDWNAYIDFYLKLYSPYQQRKREIANRSMLLTKYGCRYRPYSMRQRISNSLKGRKQSNETKLKISKKSKKFYSNHISCLKGKTWEVVDGKRTWRDK